jgi:hypothetical protein
MQVKGGGDIRNSNGVNMVKVSYMHALNYYNEMLHIAQLIGANM